MKKQLVSIIIPTFNRAHLIGETLDSIINQTYPDWECIVVDDGSTDATEAKIKDYANRDPRFRYFQRPETKPKGANACRNYGLDQSRGYYINWLDSDDLFHKDKLKIQLEAMINSDCQFSVCKSYVFEEILGTKMTLKSEVITSENPFEDFVMKNLIIPVQAPVFLKSFIVSNKFGFDETLQAGQEWELYARILAKDQHYLAIDIPLDYIRQHRERISGDITSLEKWNYFLARKKIYNTYGEQFTDKMIQYMKFYFIKTLKDFLRTGQYKKAFYVWKDSLLKFKILYLKQHLLVLTSFASFIFFKKGDKILTKLK